MAQQRSLQPGWLLVVLALFLPVFFQSAVAKEKKPSTTVRITSASLKERKIQETRRVRNYDLAVSYPQFSGEPQEAVSIANRAIKSLVDRTIETIDKTIPDQPGIPGNPMSLDCSYETYLAGPEFISLQFTAYSFTGGAHGVSEGIPFNYSLSSKSVLTFNDVFPSGQSPEKLSEMCRAYLYANPGNSAKDMIDPGTTPIAKNFENFAFGKKALVIIFQQYQVAPGCDGLPKVEFTYDKLTTLDRSSSILNRLADL